MTSRNKNSLSDLLHYLSSAFSFIFVLMLNLLRASAGAGKTHQLVQIYLTYILASPKKIPHVVVLSFTNKATQELKERILSQLYALTEGRPTAMQATLQQKLNYNEATLRQKAREALDDLLHHYNNFSIYTIDTFFQKLLRAFSYELGMSNTYQLLLEQHQLIDSCTSQLLQELPHTPALQETLIDLAITKMKQGKAWHLTQELSRWCHDLLATFNHPGASTQQPHMASSALIALLKSFTQEAIDFEETLAQKAHEILTHIQRAGLETQDFTWGEKGVIGFLKKLQRKAKVFTPSQRIKQASLDPNAWISKKSLHRTQGIELSTHTLQPLLAELLSYHASHYTHYATLQTLLLLRYRLIATQALKKRIFSHTRKHDEILIHTVPDLIKKTIEGTNTTWLRAKTGRQPLYFLIDESQDLSTAQWQGIAPLIQQTIQAGYESWLVGDAKQAIYRWRGGNPQLLLTQAAKEAGPHQTKVKDLPYNWRSKPVIIGFNNAFFNKAAHLITSSLQAELQSQAEIDQQALHTAIAHIEKAYGQVQQQLPPSSTTTQEGCVKVGFIHTPTRGNAWKKEAIERAIHTVEVLQQTGYAPSNITFLVRNNAEAQLLLQALLQHQKSEQAKPGVHYEAVASAALSLSSNPHVKLLINALQYLDRPDDQVALAALVHLYQQHVKPHVADTTSPSEPSTKYFLSLNTPENLAPFLPHDFLKQLTLCKNLSLYPLVAKIMHLLTLDKVMTPSYLTAFQEVVHHFSLRQENSLPDFLRWWDKYGAQEVATAPASEEAMTIMTIHQSKGLAFEAVIIPFCAWDLDHSPYNPPIIAAKASKAPFDQLGTIPLSYGKQLQDTYYASTYMQEKWQQYLEQLNLLYVAFTRAVHACYIFTPHLKSESIKNTAHVLNHLLQPDADHPKGIMHGQGRWDEETMTWSAGNLPLPLTSTSTSKVNAPQTFSPTSLRPQQHTHLTKRIITNHEEGIWWHDLFSKITTVASAHTVVAHYVNTQRLSASQGAAVKASLDRLFQDPRLQEWFSPRWQVHAERSITLPTGTLWRPDRVMTCGKQAVVLDFKLGNPLAVHHQQVAAYMDIIAQLGYHKVEGYLLYLAEERLVQVCER